MNDNPVLYNAIGTGYNITRQADPVITEKLFQFLNSQKDGKYLDIGCGTGNYTIALAEKGISFYGVEPSEKMLDTARLRNQEIHWLTGSAEVIPVEDQFFDGAIATLTIHHWTNLAGAFQEIARVLKPNAPFVLFTATPGQMKGYWLNHYFPDMMADSITQMPSFHTIKEAAEKAGLLLTNTDKYFIGNNLQDLFLYAGKNRPLLYLEEETRNGISSFAALAHRKEVERGLSQLRIDLNTNVFEEVKQKYINNLGDYLFVTFQKC